MDSIHLETSELIGLKFPKMTELTEKYAQLKETIINIYAFVLD